MKSVRLNSRDYAKLEVLVSLLLNFELVQIGKTADCSVADYTLSVPLKWHKGFENYSETWLTSPLSESCI